MEEKIVIKKLFELKADCTFYAEDIEDAMLKLAAHYLMTVTDSDYEDHLLNSGQISLVKVQ